MKHCYFKVGNVECATPAPRGYSATTFSPCLRASLENATGSYEALFQAGVQRRQARPKIARYDPEASASELKGKCREN